MGTPHELPSGLELVAEHRSLGRPLCLLNGGRLQEWAVGPGIPRFTLLLAIDATAYTDEEIAALASRLALAEIGYLCAWGPDCERVHDIFDLEFVRAEMRGEERPFLMTSWHSEQSLAEAVWYAIYAAWSDPEYDVPAVVFGSDGDDWRAQIRSWLCDPDVLDASVSG